MFAIWTECIEEHIATVEIPFVNILAIIHSSISQIGPQM